MPIVSLEYHDVVAADDWGESGFPGGSAATYKLSASVFAEHLRVVRDAGPSVVNDIRRVEHWDPPDRRVVWTFDDGGYGYMAHAADLLEREGWRGHLFMTTAWIGKPGFLSGTDLRDLADRGHVIGSHSRSHPSPMARLTKAQMVEEWRASVADLADVLGERVMMASVPGGAFSADVAESAQSEGIRWLFTSEPETRVRAGPHGAVLGRYTLRRGDSPRYVARLVGSTSTARWQQWAWWNLKKGAKRAAGGLYRRTRERLLDG